MKAKYCRVRHPLFGTLTLWWAVVENDIVTGNTEIRTTGPGSGWMNFPVTCIVPNSWGNMLARAAVLEEAAQEAGVSE